MRVLLIICFSLTSIYLEAQQQLVPVVDFSEENILKHEVYGCNHLSSRTSFYPNHTGFLRIYNDLGQPLMRYPGGTAANYLNLFTGYFNLWEEANAKDSSRVASQNAALIGNGKVDKGEDLSEYISFLKDGGKSNFVLNVTSMTVDETKRVFNEIADSGVQLKYVEMGNELYNGQYATVIPDVSDYIRITKGRIELAKHYFPDVKIGLVISSHVYTDESFMDDPAMDDLDRQELWYEELRKEQSFYDALVIHMYSKVGMTGVTKEEDFLTYQEAYRHALSHSDHQFSLAYEKLRSDFPNKDLWCTEYHVGGFSGDVRKYRLRHSYLGGFYASTFLLKLLSQQQFTIASWHSMIQWLDFEKNGTNLLPDNYEFGTKVNYEFFKLFKNPVINSTHFSPLAFDGTNNYKGLGDYDGTFADVDGGVFYNKETGKGYALIFNKMEHVYTLSKVALQESLEAGIVVGLEFSPDKELELQVALESEERYSITPINLFQNMITLNPYSIYKFEFSLDNSSSGFKNSKPLEKIKIYPNPSSGQFSILLPQDSQFNRYEIHTVFGKKIADGPIETFQFDVNFETSAGILYLSLHNTSNVVVTKPFLVDCR